MTGFRDQAPPAPLPAADLHHRAGRRRGRARTTWAAFLVLATITAVSCGDRSASTTTASDERPPVLRGATSGPGTELRDGLRVPPGTSLIGRVFDGQAGYGPITDGADGRWAALLLVDEEPRQALEALVESAEEAGFTTSDPSLASCFGPDDRSGIVRPQPARCQLVLDRPGSMIGVEAVFGRCGEGPPASHISLSGGPSAAEGQVPATITGTSVDEPPPTTEAPEDPSSGVPATVIPPPPTGVTPPTPSTVAPAPPATAPPGTPIPGPEPSTTVPTTVTTSSTLPGVSPSPSPAVEPEVPASWPKLPQTGAILNARTPEGTSDVAPVALLEGTVAVAPSMVDCYFLSHRSVLRVDGDPADVIDAYAGEFAERSHERVVVDHHDIGSTRVTNVVADQAGGDKWYLTVTEEPGRPTWALVETTTDP